MLVNLTATFSFLYIVLPVVGVIAGALCGIIIYNTIQKRKTDKAKETANQYIEDAINEAKNLRKEAILESKEEVHKLRLEFDKEMRDRQNEVRRQEQRIVQREETLDKKEATVDKKIEALDEQRTALKDREDEIQQIKVKELESLKKVEDEIERVSQMTKEEAKTILIKSIEEEAKRDAVRLVREIDLNAKEEADKKAKDAIASAIQKCAVDHSSDITVSVVPLPNEDMKGRIIGREGRNIRALENATGIDLIIDDTPEAVVLSGFDPIRREVARLSLEKLIGDGRIHPGRIEEVVEKTRNELEHQIKDAGESSAYETGVFNLHSDIIRLLGRLKYRTSYGQNVLKHSIEVAHLAGLLATEIGADVNLCKRAGLLHDIGKSVDHEVEGTHISIGAEIAKKYKENKEVVHCILAHHNDIPPETVEAIIVQCADAISGARPGARRESLENYVKRLEKLEVIANSHQGVEKSYAIQAGREVRIMVKPEIVDDTATLFLAKDIARQIEKEMDYPGQIKVNVIRETRSTEYAK